MHLSGFDFSMIATHLGIGVAIYNLWLQARRSSQKSQKQKILQEYRNGLLWADYMKRHQMNRGGAGEEESPEPPAETVN